MKAQRKFRRFEDDFFSLQIHGTEQTMTQLRRFLRKVCKEIKLTKPVPTMVAGQGLPVAEGGYTSYEMDGRIVLARHQRMRVIVLHELAHYIAQDPAPYHGTKFFRVYRSLLLRFSPLNTAAYADTLTHAYNLPDGEPK